MHLHAPDISCSRWVQPQMQQSDVNYLRYGTTTASAMHALSLPRNAHKTMPFEFASEDTRGGV